MQKWSRQQWVPATPRRIAVFEYDVADASGQWQACLGCGKRISAEQWFEHSQSCEELELAVELALRRN